MKALIEQGNVKVVSVNANAIGGVKPMTQMRVNIKLKPTLEIRAIGRMKPMSELRVRKELKPIHQIRVIDYMTPINHVRAIESLKPKPVMRESLRP